MLRLCYLLGPRAFGTLADYLAPERIPSVLGFDPLFQLMHERDAARAIVTALEARLRGVFNVAGPQPIPFSLLVRITGRKRLPVPEMLFHAVAGRFGLPPLPTGALSHVKFPTIIDDSLFRKTTGFAHEYDEVQTMESFRFG